MPLTTNGGTDVITLRIIVGGLVTGLLLNIVSIAALIAWGHEVPPSMTGLAGTIAGGLLGLLVPLTRHT